MAKIQKMSREINGIVVEQRLTDGFINGTAMSVAHGKNINDWFRLEGTFELFSVLNYDLGYISNTAFSRDLAISKVSATKYGEIFSNLIIVKRGSPENGGGVWLHPDLAIQLAQWCNPAFAIQVSRWIREWMMTGQNPIYPQQADIDRVVYRDSLKDEARLRMTAQVKKYLEEIQEYDNNKFRGMFFAKVHDAINIAVTSETSRIMRNRISDMLGKEVKESELIRDYFPALVLQRYISVCEAAANFMLRENLHPLAAVERACEIVLPANYQPEKIDFSENIKFVRQRLAQPTLGSPDRQFLIE